jgi:hypothetical protein
MKPMLRVLSSVAVSLFVNARTNRGSGMIYRYVASAVLGGAPSSVPPSPFPWPDLLPGPSAPGRRSARR